MNDTINNYGTIINGDVYNSNIVNQTNAITNPVVTINDPELIESMLVAIQKITVADTESQKYIEELKRELQSKKPRVGKLEAAYDWLRRNVTVGNVLDAVKLLGALLGKV